MGSSGSYSASLSINYSIKSSNPNTVEQCSDYLKSRTSPLYIVSSETPTETLIQSLLDSNTDFILDYANGCDSWHPDEDPIEGLDEYEDSENYCLYIAVTAEQLINCDLSLIPTKRTIISSDYTIDYGLLDISESIYGERDNASENSTCVTSSLLSILSRPNAKLVLTGTGSCY